MSDTTTITRQCRDCAQPFEVTQGERDFLERTFGDAALLPTKCLTCRRARRKAKSYTPVDADLGIEELVCADCDETFIFGGRDRDYFSRRGWSRPKRCRPCRQSIGRQAT
jgi:hypothetical protein